MSVPRVLEVSEVPADARLPLTMVNSESRFSKTKRMGLIT